MVDVVGIKSQPVIWQLELNCEKPSKSSSYMERGSSKALITVDPCSQLGSLHWHQRLPTVVNDWYQLSNPSLSLLSNYFNCFERHLSI